MPTYQYACTSCGEQVEAVQKFSDEPLTECPSCGGRLRKVFSAVGVVFKGSGFYKTDSRAGAKKRSETKSPEEKSGEKSGDKTGDKSGSGSSTDKPAPAASTSDTSSSTSSSSSSSSSGQVA
jgi:putative FmdB family regulatory protein